MLLEISGEITPEEKGVQRPERPARQRAQEHSQRLVPLRGRPCTLIPHWGPTKERKKERKNEENEPKQQQYPVVDVTGDGSKVRGCKERYCIGTWNVGPMNQGKLEVVKQEMARVNINTLGISKLKWTEMGEFNSDDHYIYTTVGKNPLEEMK